MYGSWWFRIRTQGSCISCLANTWICSRWLEKIKHIAQMVELFMVIYYGRFRKKNHRINKHKNTIQWAFLGAPNPPFWELPTPEVNRITSCPGHPVILSENFLGVSNRLLKRIVFRCHEVSFSVSVSQDLYGWVLSQQ